MFHEFNDYLGENAWKFSSLGREGLLAWCCQSLESLGDMKGKCSRKRQSLETLK